MVKQINRHCSQPYLLMAANLRTISLSVIVGNIVLWNDKEYRMASRSVVCQQCKREIKKWDTFMNFNVKGYFILVV